MALATLALPLAVLAHEAPEGWRYDRDCCEQVLPGTGTHCAPIPDSSVRIVPGGYVVTLGPGDHPNVTLGTHTWQVRHGDPMYEGAQGPKVRFSGDEHYHACLYPNEASLRCLYIPVGGA